MRYPLTLGQISDVLPLESCIQSVVTFISDDSKLAIRADHMIHGVSRVD